MPPVDALSYEFYKVKTPKGVIGRPYVPVRIQYRTKEPVDTLMLLDSGADFSMIQREFAEDALGIEVDALPTSETSGIGGAAQVGEAEVYIRLGDESQHYEFPIMVQVPRSRDFPKLNLMGRIPLFHEFDISFRMGFCEDTGKFVLKRVGKKHSNDRRKKHK